MNANPAHLAATAEQLMEDFLRASSRNSGSPREMYLAREALRCLLRLARAEQLLDIRRSVNILVPASARPQSVRRGKTKRSSRSSPEQKQFVFGREN